MSGVFVVLVRPDAGPITERLRGRYDSAVKYNGLPPLRWEIGGSCAVGIGPDVTGLGTGPRHVRTERLTVVGNARLDNRDEVGQLGDSHRAGGDAADLELIARAIEAVGPAGIVDCLGDFAIVTWDPASREMHAARDAFGVKQLCYADRPDHMALSSRATLLADGDAYDRDYILTYLSGAVAAPDRTPYAGVHAVPPGCIVSRSLGTSRITRFWSAADHVIDDNADECERVEAFREIFAAAVTSRMAEPGMTWSHLSGGLDSSSVVSLAQSLFEAGRLRAGVAGTVTIADSLAQGDEREYTADVLSRYAVPNYELVDDWLWRDDGVPPPLTDEPTLAYPFYARDRRIREMVRDGGGRVLLSGEGADHYLTGSLYFLADLLTDRRISEAFGALHGWAATLRQSFWRLGFQYGVRPLLPPSIRQATTPAPTVPAWLRCTATERASLRDRLQSSRQREDTGCGHYAAEVQYQVENLWQVLRAEVVESSLEVRYPFLDRRLVEFSLRLPPRLRSRPHSRKWVLREAMHGILPERVRMRTGKGGIEGRLPWSLVHEHEKITHLLRDPILSQLGFADRDLLRRTVSAATHARAGAVSAVLSPLSLETWLRVRSDRSAARERMPFVSHRRERSGSRHSPSRA
jgi:asparagine synthase (glutamine-hydrolysing)